MLSQGKYKPLVSTLLTTKHAGPYVAEYPAIGSDDVTAKKTFGRVDDLVVSTLALGANPLCRKTSYLSVRQAGHHHGASESGSVCLQTAALSVNRLIVSHSRQTRLQTSVTTVDRPSVADVTV